MSLKQLVNNKDLWDAYVKDLEEEISKLQRTLEQSTQTIDIYRVQGEIKALRRRLQLRERVNLVKY